MEQRFIIGAFIIGIITIANVGLFGFMIFNPPSEPIDINYGGQYYPCEFLLKGKPEFWDTYDLKVKHTLFSSGTENNEALLSGEIEINVGSDTKTIELFHNAEESETIEPLIIGTVQRGDRYSTVIPADSSITSWTELTKAQGKLIGYREGTGAHTIMQMYFSEDPDNLNLSFDDFEWQSLKAEEILVAFQAGQIDAFTYWEPTPAIAVDQGLGKILRSYGDIALVPVSIHTTKSFAYEHPAQIVAFLAAHLDKMEMIQNQRTEAATIAAASSEEVGSEVSASAFEDLYIRIDYSIDFNESIIADIEKTAAFLNQTVNLEYDTRFLEAAHELQNLTHTTNIEDWVGPDGIKDSIPSSESTLQLAEILVQKYGLKNSNLNREVPLWNSLIEECFIFLENFICNQKSGMRS
ncbi:MAG: hypothetical protein EAX86_13100 [Candidatus Heimdallarchaeota archaeon]|nr:hypothetical protein [Candidatus Heimdallarchaeota archaeon]